MDENKLALERMAAESATEEQELFSPYDILSMLGRRFYWLLITTTILFGVTGVVALRWPDEFKAETLILVDPQKVPERYVNTTVSMDVSGRLSTINQQLMSSTRLQRIIDTYDLYKVLKGHKTQEEIIEQMRSDIKVEIVQNFGGGNRNSLGAFRIIYVGRQAPLVAQVCNQLASLFIEENLKVREQQAEGTSEFIDTRLDLAKKKLEEEETRLRDFKMKNMGQLPEQASQNIAQLNGLEQQLRSETETINHLRNSQMLITAQINSIMQVREGSVSGVPVALGETGSSMGGPPAPTSEALVRLKTRRADTQTSLEQFQLRYTPDHPDVQKAKLLIKQIDKEIEAEEKRLAAAPPPPMITSATTINGKEEGPAATETRDPVAIYRNQLKAIETEIETRQKNEKTYEAQVRVLQERIENMPMREQEMAQTDRDVTLLRADYSSLLEKKMSADMAADLEKRQKSERFTILDPARIPERPFRPERGKLLGASFAAGLGFGFFMIFVTELRDKSVKKEDELSRIGLRILGRIPMVVTSEEAQMRRRRKMRNWALGTAATLTTLGVFSTAAWLVTKTLFLI